MAKKVVRKIAKKSFIQKYRLYLTGVLILIGIGAWVSYSKMSTPLSVNEVAMIGSKDSALTQDCSRGTCESAPAGCYFKQVQCVQAPCNPILVCSSPIPVPSPTDVPTPNCLERPACLDAEFPCKISDKPGQWCPVASAKPSTTCFPRPECPSGSFCRFALPPDGMSYCTKPTPTPTPIASAPVPASPTSCVVNPCADGAVCKLMALPPGQVYCSPKPTPASSASACRSNILNLTVFNRCSDGGFSAYGYQCAGGTMVKSPVGICMSLKAIYSKVSLECGATCSSAAGGVTQQPR